LSSSARANSAATARAWRERSLRPLAVLELLQRERACRLEQPIADGMLPLDHHQRLVDQRGEMVEHAPWLEPGVAGDRLRELDRESAGTDAKPSQHGLLVVLEQVVAPLEGGAQGLVSRQRRARTAGEQPEARVEVVPNGTEAEGRGARCRQLDRQRKAVEPTADVDDEREARIGGLEVARGGAKAAFEHRDRAVLARVLGARPRPASRAA
jgi:hypothetical protein